MAGLDDDALSDELMNLFDNVRNIDPSQRGARISPLSCQLRNCLHELDALGLFEAAAHLDMSIHSIEKSAKPKGPARAPDGSKPH